MKDHLTSPTVAALISLFDAFNRHDPAGVAAHFSPDGHFDRHVGPEPHGERHVGHAAIAGAMQQTFDAMPDAHWRVLGHWDCAPDLAVSHWLFTGTDAAGQRTECEGLDLYAFQGGMVTRKNAFRKQLGGAAAG